MTEYINDLPSDMFPLSTNETSLMDILKVKEPSNEDTHTNLPKVQPVDHVKVIIVVSILFFIMGLPQWIQLLERFVDWTPLSLHLVRTFITVFALIVINYVVFN